MNRIDAAFERARAESRAALIVFVTAGDPDLETTSELVPELAYAGADIVELGVPHSDPIAERPTIQAASHRAREGGVNYWARAEVSWRRRRRLEGPGGQAEAADDPGRDRDLKVEPEARP